MAAVRHNNATDVYKRSIDLTIVSQIAIYV